MDVDRVGVDTGLWELIGEAVCELERQDKNIALVTMCCGAAFSLTETDIVYKLTADILDEAQAVGANAIAVACPLCHANLDTRQSEIEARRDKQYRLPVFYFTQLLGLAFGIPGERLGLDKHLVDTGELLSDRTELPTKEVAAATH